MKSLLFAVLFVGQALSVQFQVKNNTRLSVNVFVEGANGGIYGVAPIRPGSAYLFDCNFEPVKVTACFRYLTITKNLNPTERKIVINTNKIESENEKSKTCVIS